MDCGAGREPRALREAHRLFVELGATARAEQVAREAEMLSAFDAEPQNAREALHILLGQRRLQVGPGPDRGFRIEGLFILPLEARAPWGQGTARACDSVIAGGRFATSEKLPFDIPAAA